MGILSDFEITLVRLMKTIQANVGHVSGLQVADRRRQGAL